MIRILRIVLKKLGIVAHRRTVESDSDLQNARIVNHLNIDLVIDVGANTGQYANGLRSCDYEGAILSLEPIPEAHKILDQKTKKDKNWFAYEPIAVGSSSGEFSFNISGNSVSSSLLKIKKKHVNAAPNSDTVNVINVKTSSLDDIYLDFLKSNPGYSNLYIKIDVQGAEWDVLKGSKLILSKARAIQLELSLAPLYEDQKLWEEINSFMLDQGYYLWSLRHGFCDSDSGQTLQFDGVYVNKSF